MDGWLDFVGWIEHHQASAEVFAAVLAAFATAVLAGLTVANVSAARKQAEASVEMAKEMREQRESGVMPVLDIIPDTQAHLEMDHPGTEIDAAGNRQERYVRTSGWLECRLRNIGLGPALNIEMSYARSSEAWGDQIQANRRIHVLGAKETSEGIIATVEDHNTIPITVIYQSVTGRRYRS